MTIWSVGWMQGGSYTAQHDRINSRADDWNEGVENRAAFKVAQNGAGNLTVDVAAGDAVVTGDDQANQGNYDVRSDAVINVTGFVATGSNTRYDVVGIQINDPNAGGAAGSNATVIRIAGTAAVSPTIPTIPNSFLPLAIVGPFTTSTTAITTSMIHDAHTLTGPTGASTTRLVSGFRDRPGHSKETYCTVADSGWLIENGQAVSRTTYARLFAEIGTTHGAGDGSTTFNVPDSRGRAAVALDNQGGTDAGRLDVANAIGGTGGEQYHTQAIAELPVHAHADVVHTHNVDPPSTAVSLSDPGHVHGIGTNLTSGAFGYYKFTVTSPAQDVNAGYTNPTTSGLMQTVTTGISGSVDIAAFASQPNAAGPTGSQGSGTPFNVMQPFILLQRMICT